MRLGHDLAYGHGHRVPLSMLIKLNLAGPPCFTGISQCKMVPVGNHSECSSTAIEGLVLETTV